MAKVCEFPALRQPGSHPCSSRLNVLHSVLVANIKVSIVQGSMLLQLNVVIVAFLINIDKKKCVTLFFSLFRFGGTLHVDSSTDGVLASHAMVMKGEEVFFIFALDTPFYIVKSYNNVFT